MSSTKLNAKQEKLSSEFFQPLAARMRPQRLAEYVGQEHLLGEGKPLRRAIEQGILNFNDLVGAAGYRQDNIGRINGGNGQGTF